MSIIPSGNRKIMEAQSSFKNDDESFNLNIDPSLVQDLPVENDQDLRTNIKQEEIQDINTENVPYEVNTQLSNINENEEDVNLKQYIFKILNELGIPLRKINAASKDIININIDLSDNTMSGFYLIPSYTPNKNIELKEAKEIALEIGNKFGLDQTINVSGNNYKVDFRSKPSEKEDSRELSSFDDLGKNKKAAGFFTTHELIKMSKNSLFDKIFKE